MKGRIENVIRISVQDKKPVKLPMAGRDSEGNLYEVDSLSFLKNGRRFLPVMGEFHFSRYEPEAWKSCPRISSGFTTRNGKGNGILKDAGA